MTNSLTYLNIALDSYSALICLLMLYTLFEKKKFNDKTSFWFGLTCLSCFLLSISDIFTWITNGKNTKPMYITAQISNFIFYLFGCVIFICFVRYVIEIVSQKVNINVWYWRFCIILFVIYCIGLILTPITDLYYKITPDNVYIRGKFFWMTTVVDLFCYIITLVILFSKRKNLEKNHFISLLSCVFIPITTQIIQYANYGIALNCAGITIAFLVIFMNWQQRLENSLSKTDQVLKERNDTISQIQENTISSLSNLVENRNSDKNHHITRIRYFVRILSEQCQKDGIFSETITKPYINLIIKSCPIHDIGNIIIPNEILNKPEKFTQEEYDLVKKHTIEGGRIINEILFKDVDNEFLKISSEIATYHHEKWNGTGYPYQLKGEDIPLSARILAIADVFDALVSPRCYKNSVLSSENAMDIIKEESGKHFDPILVKEFLKAKDKIFNIVDNFND